MKAEHAAPALGLTPQQLHLLFPFHLAADQSLRIVQTGRSLRRLCPDIRAGMELGEKFVLLQPDIPLEFDALISAASSALLWRIRNSDLQLRGQLMLVDEPRALLLLWSPWLAEDADLERHGLRVEDFALHDPVLELLQALRSHKKALREVRELADQLTAQRAELWVANDELSRQHQLMAEAQEELTRKEEETRKLAVMAKSDVVERKEAEQRLKKALSLQTAIFDSANIGIVATDNAGSIQSVNARAQQMLGYDEAELTGRALTILHDPQELRRRAEQAGLSVGRKAAPGFDILVAGARENRIEELEWTYIRKNGERFPVLLSITTIRGDDGEITGFLGVASDIAARKQAERDLLAAIGEAESANRAKSEFLATMSHEIRTPMNAVLGTLTLLRESRLDKEQRLWAKTAFASAHSLLGIIDDILDFSKIEAGKLELQLSDFSLKTLLEGVLQLFRLRAEAKGLPLILKVAEDTPDALRGDPMRLRQILVNLVGNALKFTERGFILLAVEPLKTDTGQAPEYLLFHVRDSGIGIGPEAKATLFNEFVQADSGASRRYGGTGLGLAISKRLTHMMGGEMGVDSRLGRGSDFWFTVRMETAAAPLPQPVPEPARRLAPTGGRILVAEDGEANRMVITAMLGKAGFQVEAAPNGRAALEAARAADYDLILMDVQMPEMNGYQATQAIRALPDERARVPILALTANALQDNREACLAAGMNDFIAKPVDKNRLLQTIAHWLNCEAPPQTAPDAADDEFNTPNLLDEAVLRELAEDTDEGVMRETVAIFFVETVKRLQTIENADGDGKILEREAHAMKSGARTIGAQSLAEAAKDLEQAAGDPHEAALQAAAMRRVFRATREAYAARGLPVELPDSAPSQVSAGAGRPVK